MTHHSATEYNAVDYARLPRICPTCMRRFDNRQQRDNHQYRFQHWGNQRYSCLYCHRRFVSDEEMREHMNNTHFANYRLTQSALQDSMLVLSRTFMEDQIPNVEYLRETQNVILQNVVGMMLYRWNAMRAYLCAWGRFAKYSDSGVLINVQNFPLTTRTQVFFRHMPAASSGNLNRFMSDLADRVDRVETRGSGYVLLGIVGLQMHCLKATFAGGSSNTECSHSSHHNAMRSLTHRQKSCLADVSSHWRNGCLWSAIAQHYLKTAASDDDDDGKEHENMERRRELETRVFCEQFMKRGRFADKKISLDDLPEVEELNKKKLDFALNVYLFGKRKEIGASVGLSEERKGLSENIFYPAYVSERKKKAKTVINLLLIGDYRKNPTKMHYVFVSDLGKLVLPRNKNGRYACCDICLNAVNRHHKEEHEELCKKRSKQVVMMPKLTADGEVPRLEFKPGRKRFLSPFVGFLEFESANHYPRRQEEEAAGGSCGARADDEDLIYPEEIEELTGEQLLDFMSKGTSYTHDIARQTPITYALLFTGGDENQDYGHRIRSSDTRLLPMLMDDLEDCYERLNPYFNDVPVCPILSDEERQRHEEADVCWMCSKEFSSEIPGRDKVRDHEHSSVFEGRYLGAACRACNSGRQHARGICVFVHNLDKYVQLL